MSVFERISKIVDGYIKAKSKTLDDLAIAFSEINGHSIPDTEDRGWALAIIDPSEFSKKYKWVWNTKNVNHPVIPVLKRKHWWQR